MNRPLILLQFVATAALGAVLTARVCAAVPVSEWRFVQTVAVPEAGPVKLSLPPATLGAARPDLEDLRILDAAGNEQPYAVERVAPARQVIEWARSFQAELAEGETILLIETVEDAAVEGVTLDASHVDFLKAASVDGSNDRESWTMLTTAVPVFRQAGSFQLHLSLPPGTWRWLRIRVDDRRSAPVAFTGARVHRPLAPAPVEPCPAEIAGTETVAGVTRLRVQLPAAHLQLAAIEFDTPEALFTREVQVLAVRAADTATNEIRLAQGTIYRLALPGQPVSSNLTLHVEAFAPSPDLVFEIRNHDSPPLALRSVRLLRRPVHLVFRAPTAGEYRLLTGHRECPAPRYDLAALSAGFTSVPLSGLQIGPLAPNPDYLSSPPLGGVEDHGATLDVSAWRFRKPVKVTEPGVQALGLDLEVLSGAEPDLADLRLMRGPAQVPFLRDNQALTRTLAPAAVIVGDPDHPRMSRWQLRLPYPRLPLSRLTCASPTALFERRVELYEEPADERGVRYRRPLGSATWSRRPADADTLLSLELAGTTLTDTFILETDNGDNPAIVLDRFELTCRVPRLVFKLGNVPGDLFLYYGNREASAPHYDLSLVAAGLSSADKVACTLGGAEELLAGSWRERLGRTGTGSGSPWFWIVLVGVGVGLLVIVVRLLPKPPAA